MPRKVKDKFKELVEADIRNYKNYSIVDGRIIYRNPDYNIINQRNIYGKKVLFCPQLFDEDSFAFFSRYLHDDCQVRCTYTKTLNYLISFSFVSMLIYSLACSDRTSRNNFLILGNWIPKTIVTDERIENQNNQYTFDEDGDLIWWSPLSTVNFIRKSEKNNDYEKAVTGKVIDDYIKIVEARHTMVINTEKHDEDGNSYYEKQFISQNSIYKPTEKLWSLVEKARKGELTFVTIERDKIKEFFHNNIRIPKSNNEEKIRKINPDNKKFDKVYIKNLNKDFVKKHSGWRKIGEDKPFVSLRKGTSNPDIIQNCIPVCPAELCIRSLFDCDIPESFEYLSMDIDKFYETYHPECEFSNDSDVDAQTYFEFDPDLLIKALKDKTLAEKYDNHMLYQIYEVLSKCEVYKGKYYFNMKYIRKENGRFYGKQNIQNLNKELRKIVLSKYQSVDMNCGVYSILLNIGKLNGYNGKTTEIEQMVSDKKTYRKSLVDEELGITLSDVKEKLTMISFGCKMNPEKMLVSSEYEFFYGNDEFIRPYHTALYKNEDPERMVNISKWCNKPKVIELHNEIESLGKFMIQKYIRVNKDNTKTLHNCIGKTIEINKKTRNTFGTKLAFIYQSEESRVLKSIYDNFKVGKRKLKHIRGAIGLLLHDGIYIHKDIIKKFDDISEKMSEYVKNAFGYDIKYETE